MLTDKYKPTNFENFIGNLQNISSIQNWLINWNLENKSIKKCALISGPSGIGKTLCIELLIIKYNLNPIFISPDEKSDKEFFQNYIIPSIQIEKNILLKKNILVINDIDCYDDYGFIANITTCIKESKIPIIATCNNRYDQSIKPIISNCLDIKFQKPLISDIMKFLSPIFKKESFSTNDIEIKKIIEESNCDIRNILINLQLNYKKLEQFTPLKNQMVSHLNSSTKLPVTTSNDAPHERPILNLRGYKDKSIQQTNIFDLTKSFMSQNIELNEKNTLFWLNNDILPLMIHENYPLSNIKMKNEVKHLENIADSIASLSDIDLIDKEIKKEASNWELLPYIGWNLISSVSNCHPKAQIKFTEFLTKTAQRNKNKKQNQCKETKDAKNKAKEPKKSKEPKKTKDITNKTNESKESKKPKLSKKVKLIIED